MFNEDYDEPARVKRLENSFAIRDLLAGAEFQVIEDDDNDEVSETVYTHDELNGRYYNYEALDFDCNEEGKAFGFINLREKMADVTSDGKVKKLIKQHGQGDRVPADSVVYIHYFAHHELEERPFDNTYLRRGNPERYQLGKGNLIYGLELAILTMSMGEISQFLIEPEYAYGVKGCPPRIPQSVTVLFQVQLVNFVDSQRNDFKEHLDCADKSSFEYAYNTARKNHLFANDLFKQNKEKAAIKRYEAAVNLLLGCRYNGDEEEAKRDKLLLKLYTNLSVCNNKIKLPKRVCINAQDAVYIDSASVNKNSKLLYNWGSALLALGDFEKSAEKLKAALRLEPNNLSIRKELSLLNSKKTDYTMQEKLYFQKALGSVDQNISSSKARVEENDGAYKNNEIQDKVKEMLEEKFDEARKGKTVTLDLPPNVLDEVDELCVSLAAKDLLCERQTDPNTQIEKIVIKKK